MSAIGGRVIADRGNFQLDIALEVAPQDRVGIIGPNGSGKSTLLQALAGLTPVSRANTATVHGTLLQHLPPEHRGIGYLAQDGLLFPHLTVRDNVAFGPRARGRSRAAARARADRILTDLGASHLATKKPSTLSGGERQRVALARALATDPNLLILDEPFSALDVDAAAEIRELVAREVQARGLSLLVVTHDLVDALRLTDRVVVLERGRAVEVLPTRELSRAPASRFAASFAGLARVAGVVSEGDFVTESGHRISLAGLVDAPGRATAPDPAAAPLESVGVDSMGPDTTGRALLLVAPDAVEIEVDAAGEDAVVGLVGDGSWLLARLASGLRARVDFDRAPAIGERVRVRVTDARIRPHSRCAG